MATRIGVTAPRRTPSPRVPATPPSRTTSPRYGSPAQGSLSNAEGHTTATPSKSTGRLIRDARRSRSAPPTEINGGAYTLFPFLQNIINILSFDNETALQSLAFYILSHTANLETVIQQLDAIYYPRLMDVLHLVFTRYRSSFPRVATFCSYWILSLHHSSGHATYPVIQGLYDVARHPSLGGGFSDIYKGKYQGMKVVLKSARDHIANPVERHQLEKAWRRELMISIHTEHPNVLAPFGVSHDALPDARLSIVYPEMENGDIGRYVRDKRCNRVQLLHQAALGLHFLHSLKPSLVHGDIKPGNILIRPDGTACISDIGLGSFAELALNDSSRNMGYSVRYCAPEVFVGDDERKTISGDIYAFAMTMFEVISETIPFAAVRNCFKVMRLVEHGDRPARPETRLMVDRLWSVVTAEWRQEPQERPPLDWLILELEDLSRLPIFQMN